MPPLSQARTRASAVAENEHLLQEAVTLALVLLGDSRMCLRPATRWLGGTVPAEREDIRAG